MSRKTLTVEFLKKKINDRIAMPSATPEIRKELASLLSFVLHETGNYRGFNYVDWMQGGCRAWQEAGEPADKTPYFGDMTKVYFF